MIEIKCTKTEQRKIIDALMYVCLFPHRAPYCTNDLSMTCKKCLEKNIKWEITCGSKK